MGLCASRAKVIPLPSGVASPNFAPGPLSIVIAECKKLIFPCSIYVYSSELDRPLVTFRYDDKEETLEVCPPFSSEIVRVDSSSLWFKAFVADSVVNIHDNLTLIVHAENARNRSPGNALAAIGECLNARSHRFAEVVLLWSDDRGHVQRYTIMRHNAQSTT